MNTIFTPYLVEIFVRPKIWNTALGVVRTAGLIIAMLVQPAMGLLSDRSTSRFGRRKPFILVGVLLDLLLLVLLALASGYWVLFAATLLISFRQTSPTGHCKG